MSYRSILPLIKEVQQLDGGSTVWAERLREVLRIGVVSDVLLHAVESGEIRAIRLALLEKVGTFEGVRRIDRYYPRGRLGSATGDHSLTALIVLMLLYCAAVPALSARDILIIHDDYHLLAHEQTRKYWMRKNIGGDAKNDYDYQVDVALWHVAHLLEVWLGSSASNAGEEGRFMCEEYSALPHGRLKGLSGQVNFIFEALLIVATHPTPSA